MQKSKKEFCMQTLFSACSCIKSSTLSCVKEELVKDTCSNLNVGAMKENVGGAVCVVVPNILVSEMHGCC